MDACALFTSGIAAGVVIGKRWDDMTPVKARSLSLQQITDTQQDSAALGMCHYFQLLSLVIPAQIAAVPKAVLQ